MALEVSIQKRLGDFSLSLDFSAGQGCLAILGASGCGKTVTLRSIAGIVTPDEGRVALGERVLFDSAKGVNLPPRKRRVGYLFQNYALFPNMTVAQNIAAGLRGGSRRETEEQVAKLAARFRLEGLEDRYPAGLSGGQQQRAALARALACAPEVLLLDEPFSALDAHLKEELVLELGQLLAEYRGVSILVTHSRDEAFRLSRRLMVLEGGRRVAMGETRDIFRRPGTVQAARLTGCKNIARAEKKGEHLLEIPGWGVTLRTAEAIPEGITHLGIRAHDFHPAGEGEVNRLPLLQPVVTEGPFERQVVFAPRPGGEARVWWKMERDFWSTGGTLPKEVAVREEHILLLTEG